MNKEQQELLDDVYDNYCTEYENGTHLIGTGLLWMAKETKDTFVYRSKTDSEFSQKWGLKIEERELSLEERVDIFNTKMKNEGLRTQIATVGVDENYWKSSLEKTEHNIPTKLITVTYNNKTIESTNLGWKETKFKPKDTPNEYLKFGVYFKSENDISTQYLIELCEGRFQGNALVKIYTTDILDNHFETDGLVNGLTIGLPEQEMDWIAEVDLYGKYFLPKFKNQLQLYYDDVKYYEGKQNTNSITSLMECINYAIEYGLSESGIKPY